MRSFVPIILFVDDYFVAVGNVNAGTITGDVKFVDNPPNLAPVKVTKDQDYCGETLPNESYLVDVNGGLKNVVVFLEAAPPAIPADLQKLNMIENTGCRYAPRILVQKGERIRIKNTELARPSFSPTRVHRADQC